eukprot:gnl/MRDRNA2_/MRDRNA2_328321_c0_seq1.p1 gnl/MRDRNA2_/MRDRNA2_328321_c0~~gnl/MRDRNA2_/MRDRNA2_328321_c0_seq1.p1  ORF type:complete len:127 (+),score=19.14 gnl/MRDRNA2_/MRDRNA2_328321_c0_seq1:1-381(+)
MQLIFLHEEDVRADPTNQPRAVDLGADLCIGQNVRDASKLQYLIESGYPMEIEGLEANFSSMECKTAIKLVSLLILAGMPLTREWVISNTFGLINARARILQLVEKFQGVFTSNEIPSSGLSVSQS